MAKQNAIVEELLDIKLLPVKCTKRECPVYSRCTMLPTEVVGQGKVKAIFIGQGGGTNEGSLRRPFVGRAGMTQRKIIRHAKQDLGLKNKQGCYAMGNICRFAPGWEEKKNRTPTEEELSYCLPYLKRDIYEINPKTIVLLGDAAFHAFFPDLRTTEYRGKFLKLAIKDKTFKVIFTYHPSYGLRKPDILGKILHDVKLAFGYKQPDIYTMGKSQKKKDTGYKILDRISQVKQLVKEFRASKSPVCLDIEALNLQRVSGNKVISLQLSNDGDIGYVIPLHHPESPFSIEDTPKIVKLMNYLFSNTAAYPFVIGQNIKYDYTVILSFLGIRIEKPVVDTMCAAFLLDENLVKDEDAEEDYNQAELGGIGLANLLRMYGYNEEWYFDAKKQSHDLYNQPLKDVAKYGGADAALTWRLLRCQFEEAKNQNYLPQLMTMLLHFYSQQIKFFSRVELNGMPVNEEYLSLLMSEKESPIIKHIRDTLKELYALPSVIKANSILTKNQRSVFGDVWLFDINKPAHQVLLFFDILKLEPTSIGKSGKPSVGSAFKKAYAEVPEVALYNKYIRGTKLFGTYVKQFWEIFVTDEDAKDGRIRAQFKGTRARTGRSSVSDPNLQQLVRDKEGDDLPRIVRKLFVAEPGKVFVKLDLMAAEVRGWGEQAKDKAMAKTIILGAKLRKKYFFEGPDEELLKRLKTEGDIHKAFASLFYAMHILEVTKDMRSDSKNLTFGVIYGLGIINLAASIKKTVEETQSILKMFFSKFPQGSKWLKNICTWAFKRLYVESPLGRRRRLWYYLIDFPLDERSSRTSIIFNKYDGLTKGAHGKGDRRAKNTPIQGTASDLNFIGAFIVQAYIDKHNKPWKAINVVHDSLELEVPVEDVKETILLCKLCYESMIKKYLKLHFDYTVHIPIEIEFEVGLDMASTIAWDGAYDTLDNLQNKMIAGDKERVAA